MEASAMICELQKLGEIATLENNIAEAQTALDEYAELDGSSQLYSITDIGSSIDPMDPRSQSNDSYTKFNFRTGIVEVELATISPGTIAHELKHAFQFESGTTSMMAAGV